MAQTLLVGRKTSAQVPAAVRGGTPQASAATATVAAAASVPQTRTHRETVQNGQSLRAAQVGVHARPDRIAAGTFSSYSPSSASSSSSSSSYSPWGCRSLAPPCPTSDSPNFPRQLLSVSEFFPIFLDSAVLLANLDRGPYHFGFS